jgi:hypothetical protein
VVLDGSRLKAGDEIDDLCRACKIVRRHAVVATPAPDTPLRVRCGYCGSEHNYRGVERAARSAIHEKPIRSFPTMSPSDEAPATDLETMLRRVIREECGLTPVAPAEKWRGGELVLRPGKPGLQEKVWPVDTFFHKVVMLRNRLRVLEQQVNGAEQVPEDVKVKLQGYITACYGSLTSFNILFAEESDRFRGTGGGD